MGGAQHPGRPSTGVLWFSGTCAHLEVGEPNRPFCRLQYEPGVRMIPEPCEGECTLRKVEAGVR
jgi:hypothetical protein